MGGEEGGVQLCFHVATHMKRGGGGGGGEEEVARKRFLGNDVVVLVYNDTNTSSLPNLDDCFSSKVSFYFFFFNFLFFFFHFITSFLPFKGYFWFRHL